MLVIFYSRGAFPARQAAVRYLGGRPGEWQVDRLRRDGFWHVGDDPQGRGVYALGGVSRPDVIFRAFHGMVGLFGLSHAELVLQPVSSSVAWADMGSALLRKLGLRGMAEQLEAREVAQSWAEADLAVVQLAAKTKSAQGEAR
jgi:hypothetical protein